MKNKIEVNDKTKKRKGTVVALSIATGILAATTLGFGIAFAISDSYAMEYGTQLENVYQKNLYDLVESINNTDIKLSKILASTDTNYQNKMLLEVANNTELAQQSISSLPISQGSVSDSVKFVNQVGGYTTTLAKKTSNGDKISNEEKQTLLKIKDSMEFMKEKINKFFSQSKKDYSILEESLDSNNDMNSFSIQISKIKSEEIDYPTMIYDGPFSDSQTNFEIKGLTGNVVSKEEAYNEITKCFNDISNIAYEGEINSRIETYNYKISTTNENTLYAQVSKIGGNIITISGTCNDGNLSNIDMDSAQKIAINFALENGIENPVCVWEDSLKNQAYFNIAPKQDGVILYPDLVKVKVDLTAGTVIGYDASTYFTNHTKRLLPKASINLDSIAKDLPEEYIFGEGRLVLAPLEYSREVLCYEFIAKKNESTYYFYINAQTGKQENILKVIETTDGNKLM